MSKPLCVVLQLIGALFIAFGLIDVYKGEFSLSLAMGIILLTVGGISIRLKKKGEVK